MRRKVYMDFELHCIQYKDNNWYIAHCLELDLAAQGRSPQGARNTLADMIRDQVQFAVENDMMDSLFRPAPEKYWRQYHKITAQKTKESILSHPPTSRREVLRHMEISRAPANV